MNLTTESQSKLAGYDAPIEANVQKPVLLSPLQLDYTPEGDRCIYCDADAYTCEHYEETDYDWSQYADKESDAERNA